MLNIKGMPYTILNLTIKFVFYCKVNQQPTGIYLMGMKLGKSAVWYQKSCIVRLIMNVEYSLKKCK